ncbi:hypothetical protein D9M71_758540 [compost metagenome]
MHRLVKVECIAGQALVEAEPEVGVDESNYQPNALFPVGKSESYAHQVELGKLSFEVPQPNYQARIREQETSGFFEITLIIHRHYPRK